MGLVFAYTSQRSTEVEIIKYEVLSTTKRCSERMIRECRAVSAKVPKSTDSGMKNWFPVTLQTL
jgi:hypothetical protein